MYQLCLTDEYGQTSIESTAQNAKQLVEKAKKLVTERNMNNPLAAAEKIRQWDCYFVELTDEDGEEIDDAFYAGYSSTGKPRIAVLAERGVDSYVPFTDAEVVAKIYIGTLDEKPTYGQTPELKDIDDPAHPFLADKSVYFIRGVAAPNVVR